MGAAERRKIGANGRLQASAGCCALDLRAANGGASAPLSLAVGCQGRRLWFERETTQWGQAGSGGGVCGEGAIPATGVVTLDPPPRQPRVVYLSLRTAAVTPEHREGEQSVRDVG